MVPLHVSRPGRTTSRGTSCIAAAQCTLWHTPGLCAANTMVGHGGLTNLVFNLEGRHRLIRTHSEPCSHFILPRHGGRLLGHPGRSWARTRAEESTRKSRRRSTKPTLPRDSPFAAATAGHTVKGKGAKHDHGPLARQYHTADSYEMAVPTDAEPLVHPLRLPRLVRHQALVREPALPGHELPALAGGPPARTTQSPTVDEGKGARMMCFNLATKQTSSLPCLGTRPYERHRLLNRAVAASHTGSLGLEGEQQPP
mmetsp:Transcript_100160/g.287804  ORF Transcript_100160/g.287804 Transcript_100160/m.287804 type:complete len:255 (+) Transcript_100160:97-861(+)